MTKFNRITGRNWKFSSHRGSYYQSRSESDRWGGPKVGKVRDDLNNTVNLGCTRALTNKSLKILPIHCVKKELLMNAKNWCNKTVFADNSPVKLSIEGEKPLLPSPNHTVGSQTYIYLRIVMFLAWSCLCVHAFVCEGHMKVIHDDNQWL
jgi:hypothetical protein